MRNPSYFNTPTEPQVLLVSIWATFGMAALGIVLGLAVGSQAIIFDGVFAVIDASMTVLSLFVARLLAREGSRRFQYGYWHLEPLVAAFNGSILLVLCVYAIVNGIRGLLTGGGGEVSLDGAAIYSVLVCAVCVALYLYQRHANRRLDSALIRIDMQSFMMSGCITIALFFGFALAALVEQWGWPQLRPYADSLVLLLLALGLLPMPVRIVAGAMRDVFLIAPEALHRHVRQVVSAVVERYGLVGFKSYVAKSGRMHLVEIHILVPPDFLAGIARYDAIRQEIADELGPAIRLDQWLSISFTAKPSWT
ncbi:cation transporter [Robbsia sp. Bb-Pol-6]|uniref:Cation transporter n=1 Tax=Robbsia betulipollinis TaxID=2981849 RepID=A0ABT3ZNZ6_9BURK|nr:cation transporter [Robbsia betulipollinis]MCY0388274.1 cation transporter [Robbsia betulipollinis]